MAFKLNGSHLVALAITAAIGGWMYTGKIVVGGQDNPDIKAITERETERSAAIFKVRTRVLEPQQRRASLLIRGRTATYASVTVRAETGGTVEKRHVVKGQMVKPGDLLCTLDKGVRMANLAQAKAQLEQAQFDYNATNTLAKKGFAAKTKLSSLKAAVDGAKAAVAQVEQEIGRTEIRASTAGQVQEPIAEAGDNLSPGGVCVTLMENDPLLFVGQVSESNIENVFVGMETITELVTGQKVRGEVSFIASSADARTRTFLVEIKLPNPDLELRAGVTAKSLAQSEPSLAFNVSPSWLTLADDGQLGVRAVDSKNVVYFVPLQILSQTPDALWVSGLKPGTNVITVGHNYVVSGATVDPVSDSEIDSDASDSAKTSSIDKSNTASDGDKS